MTAPAETDDLRLIPIAGIPEPRWPVLLAIAVSGLVYASLPEYLSVGPRWLLLILLLALEIPALFFRRIGRNGLSQWAGYAVSLLLTLFVLASLVLLVMALPAHKEAPVALLASAVALWVSNILTFALWYWRLDGGGPLGRDSQPGHNDGAFLFPQMTLPHYRNRWSPRFLDYLFLAFNTATAFSPTDVPVLSRWAKVLVMLQSSISLAIIAILVGRAINIM
jgi:uncharacterized membrane protein